MSVNYSSYVFRDKNKYSRFVGFAKVLIFENCFTWDSRLWEILILLLRLLFIIIVSGNYSSRLFHDKKKYSIFVGFSKILIFENCFTWDSRLWEILILLLRLLFIIIMSGDYSSRLFRIKKKYSRFVFIKISILLLHSQLWDLRLSEILISMLYFFHLLSFPVW